GSADWVSRALLHHSIAVLRGTASLWFGLDEADHAVPLPGEWQNEWADAFVAAPLASVRGRDNYRLGEQLCRLVRTNPDLVERWLTARLANDAFHTLLLLPTRAESCLNALPSSNRHNVLRQVASEARAAVLALFLDEDADWMA